MSSTATKKRLQRSSRAQAIQTSKLSENSDPNRIAPNKSPSASKKKKKPMPSKTPIRATPSSTSHKKPAKQRPSAKQDNMAPIGNNARGLEAGERGRELVDKEVDGSVRMRRIMLEEAMVSVPEPGAGRVMYLVKTFERLLSIKKDDGAEEGGEKGKRRVVNWALPGLRQPPKAELTDCSPSPLSSPLPAEDLDGELCGDDRLSLGSDGSDDELGRNRRNSTGSSGKSWDKKLRVTHLKPFKLRTEQRGRCKEENFIRKVKEMILEEEKRRIPVAQGLPWTTDEPQSLTKPHTKDPTEPLDVVLHSDVRAAERAKFDNYLAENLSFIEQIKLERERQQKLEEEEELKRLRRELVPRAQPMPYFDHPFIPKRSSKPLTVPKEPRFHLHAMKELETT